jgi:chromosome segregation ATPase
MGDMSERYSNILSLLNSSVEGFASALNTVQDFDGLKQWEQALVTASTPLHDVVVLQSEYNSENKALVNGALQVLTEWAQQHRRVEELYKSVAVQLTEWQLQHSTSLRQNSDMLRDQLGHLAQNTEVTRRVLAQLSETIDKDGTIRDELRTRIPSLVASLSDIAKDLHETQRQNNEAMTALRDISKPMVEMAKSVNIQVANILDTVRQQTDSFYRVQSSVNQTVEISNKGFASNISAFNNNLASIIVKTEEQKTEGLNQALQSLDNSANHFAEQLAKNLDSFKSALANALPGKTISIIQILMMAIIIVLLVVGLARLR